MSDTHEPVDDFLAMASAYRNHPQGADDVEGGLSNLTDKLDVRSISTSGPSHFFNPTNVRVRVKWKGSGDSSDPASDMALLWRSRDSRKCRNSIAVPRAASMQPSNYFPDGSPKFSSSSRQVYRGLWRMSTTFPYWSMAWWVAIWFVAGSAIFVVNALCTWLPVAFPSTEFPGESDYVVGITDFVGSLAFVVGALIAYLEAVNDGSFHGSAMKRFIDSGGDDQKQWMDDKLRSMLPRFSKRSSKPIRNDSLGLVSVMSNISELRRPAIDFGIQEGEDHHSYDMFRWWPTWSNFRQHHLYEIGFHACATQLLGSVLYTVTGVVGLPGIYEDLQAWQKNVAYWSPDIVGSAVFVLACFLLLFETQKRWYKPQAHVLGWWVGFWSLWGSVGFLVGSAFGPIATSMQSEYAESLACFIGSLCFMISSIVQLYEAVNRNPIEELHEPRDTTISLAHRA